mmetsp:Transcript_16792/g.14693  ORF Transcript_16792/g.14693 Transcript_16792/m.14693 type:complete len:108 (+) Transcript_16792:59-382(+)
MTQENNPAQNSAPQEDKPSTQDPKSQEKKPTGDEVRSEEAKFFEKEPPPIKYFKLFKFATRKEKLLMFAGFLASAINGLALPMFALVFGRLTQEFSQEDNDLVEQAE